MNSKSPLRNSLWLLIAVMAFFAMAASSPQCAQSTQDRGLNPVFDPLTNECITKCNNDWREDWIDVKAEFKMAKAECNGVPGCINEAAIIHDAAILEINGDRDDCKEDCEHLQGGVIGGQ
jgi:hypothetical protein